MRIRGERECQQCGEHWSYYETGSITCPACGSPVSVGVGERVEHTDAPAELDLDPVRAAIDEVPLPELAEQAAAVAREYARRTGFVRAGELQPLDDTYLAAVELRHVGSHVARAMRVEDPAELYFLDLLAGADEGERPGPEEVPRSLREPHGLAVTSAVDAYQTDLRRYLEDPADVEPAVSSVLSALTTHRKRIEALDGDVDPAEAEGLIRTVRDLSTALREDDESALARAQERL